MVNQKQSSISFQIAKRVKIDPRSLHAFRISLGIVLLVDVIVRATSLDAHYTDTGALPSALVAQGYEGTWRWSLHFISGTFAFQSFLFAIGGLAAVCLTIGFHSRIATVVCWVWWASVQVRTPLLQNGGDDLLRMLLFWSMFLPLPPQLFSGRHKAIPIGMAGTIASAAILLQVSMMYFFAGSWKLTGDWINGNELHRILCDGNFARPLAYVLQASPRLTSIAGTFVVFAEHLLPVLLWIPSRFWRARGTVILTLALMHVGIEFTFTIGLFSFVCWTALLLFIPAGLWDFFERLILRRGSTDLETPRIVRNEDFHSRLGWVTKSLRIAIVSFSLIFVVVWNLADRGVLEQKWIPTSARRVGELLSLPQSWRLFDYASDHDGWFIVVARLPDYRYFDLLRDGIEADDVTFTRPAYPYRSLPDHRWRKLFDRLVNDRSQAYREALCRYLATRWDRRHDPKVAVQAIELHYMQELDDPNDPDAYMQRFLCVLELDK